MHGEDQGRQECPGNGKFPQNDPNQQGFGYVQDEVAYVVAGRIHPPHPPLDPESGIGHWPIINRFDGTPEAVQAVWILNKVIGGQKYVVVRNKSVAKRLVVSNQDD